jgi:hypothetical protein
MLGMPILDSWDRAAWVKRYQLTISMSNLYTTSPPNPGSPGQEWQSACWEHFLVLHMHTEVSKLPDNTALRGIQDT